MLDLDEEHVVSLASLAMAGYRWSASVSGADPEAVSVQLRRGEIDASRRPGASVPEEAVLRGVAPGVAHVRLEQRRSWERDQPPAQTREFDVTVRPR
jgi:predicted secreted protein